MQRPQFNIIIKSQAGLGYVAILVLLAILSTMGLAFIYKVGLMSSITLNRRTSMQAHYLAESAANHALWLMLNDPGFAPESDKYYMHSLGDGRYGYKVRMPTETTFATVATVGAMGDIATQQSYVQYIIPSNVFTAYGSSTSSLPRYRRLIGAQWTDPGDVLFGGANTIYWLELEGCPIRKELVAGIIDSIGEIKVAIYDGVTWGNTEPFGHADRNYKGLGIAYESQSGNALVVARDGTDTPLYYNIWDGTSWAFANPQSAFSLPGGNIHDVVMASQPGGNEILIAVVTSWDEIQLVQWNGSTFNDLGTIEGTTARNDFRMVEIIYEHQSGDAMVVWSRNGDSALKYRMWNGATLAPEGSLPDFGGNENYVIRGAADPDPTSDYIVVAAIDNFYDISVAVWDGDAWIDSREIETAASTNLVQSFDVTWEAAGEDVVIAWAPWDITNVRYLVWQKGTALADSTVLDGPDLQATLWLVRLLPISGTEKIVLLGENTSKDLRYCLWTGNQFKGDPGILLETDVPVQNDVAFDLAEANVPRSGGTGTGSGVNQPPVVDAGPDQTLNFPTVEAKLGGTVTDDGLPNPPATVTTAWSQVSGPGTANFENVSQVDTGVKFSEAGSYVLRLTADDSDLTASDEVTITISKSCTVLFVVPDELNLGSLDSARKALLESWGFAVVAFTAAKPQADYDLAVSNVDVVYVSSTVYYADVTSKLKWLPVGVVNEVSALTAYLGFTSGSSGSSGTQTAIVDNTHEITSPFSTGNLTITSSTQSLHRFVNTIGPGFQTLSTTTWSADPMLMTLDEGDELLWGGNAPARRVMLPWGGSAFNVSALNDDGKTILKRAIEWVAEGACSVVGSCNPDYTPNTKVGEFSTSAYGSNYSEGLAYIPFGKSFYSQAVPDGGALISVDMGSDMFYFTDLAGNLITSLATGSGTHTGVTLVETGTWANHLAVSDKFNDEIKYFDLSGNFISSFSTNVSADLNSATPEDVAFIGDTASGTYNYHLAIADPGRNKIFLVDQNGVWVSSIDISAIVTNVMGAVHIPQTDKLLLVHSDGQAFIVDFAGNLWNQYDTPSFGAGSAQAITINTITCDHLISDPSNDLVLMLNLGGAGDTDPPTPNPMTWASPPTADGPNSIRMTATTASDPSGVEYYFECTAGGGNDSGWQDSATYADTGLSSTTSYTYRVKARDKSASQNETGWSPETSATTTSNVMYVQDIAMGYRKHATKRWGQATVWIRSEDGENVSGAIVSGDWSGAVSGTSMGTTGSDGKVMLESPEKKDGGTFIFTVTNVTKLGYIYDSSLNVETSDSITPP